MLAGFTVAMPTKEEFAKVRADVMELTAGMDVADVLGLVAKAETEASKYLLLCKAAELHVKGSDYAAAAADLEALYLVIPDLEPSAVVGEIQKVARGLKAKDAPQLLDLLRRSQALAKGLRAKKPNLQILAELRASVGQWNQAQELFAKQGGEVAKMVEDETELKNLPAVADFWWNYEPKTAAVGDVFKMHAARLYQTCLDDGLVKAPLKIALIRKRIDEQKQGVEETKPNFQLVLQSNSKAKDADAKQSRRVAFSPACELEFMPCPAGTFFMGSSKTDADSAKSDWKGHRVTISRSFWMAKTSVTYEHYQAVVGKMPDDHMNPLGDPPFPLDAVGGKKTPCGFSYVGARGFVKILNERFGHELPKGYVFRFPTEAEWDYAAQAGKGQYLDGRHCVSFKQRQEALKQKGLSVKKSDRLPWAVPLIAIGTKSPNSWGICDMIGNGWTYMLDTLGNVTRSNWSGPLGLSEVYQDDDVDPLLIAKGSTRRALMRGKGWGTGASFNGKDCTKIAFGCDDRFHVDGVVRLVIGPDLEKEKQANAE